MEEVIKCPNCIRFKKQIEILESKNIQLESRINQLERRLLAYENAHTPPSKSLFKKKIKI